MGPFLYLSCTRCYPRLVFSILHIYACFYMPRFVLDPAVLALQYPKACPEKPQKVRIVAQVADHVLGVLYLTRVPNLPQLHTQIVLDGTEAAADPVPINIADLTVDGDCLRRGAVVSVWGAYDGTQVVAWDCLASNGQELLGGGSDILAEASNLKDL